MITPLFRLLFLKRPPEVVEYLIQTRIVKVLCQYQCGGSGGGGAGGGVGVGGGGGGGGGGTE